MPAQGTTAKSAERSVEALWLANARIKNIVGSIEQEVKSLRKLFDNTRKGFGEFANKYIKIPYEHILMPELSMGRKGIRFSGFHHDLHGLLEKSGIFKLKNKIMGKHGVYKADVWFNGIKSPGKTFFPQSWSREKVISKVMEAYDDFLLKGAINFREEGGKFVINGFTSEGIKVEMFLTKSGKITSAFPKV